MYLPLFTYRKRTKPRMNFIFSLDSPGEVQAVTSSRSSPVARRAGEQSLYLSGVLQVGDPDLYVIYCHFCTKYELICSFNTFCTCRFPFYVQKTYITTYEFHFQLAFSESVRDVTRCFPVSRRPGEHSLYISGVLRGGDPDLYIFTVFSVLNMN